MLILLFAQMSNQLKQVTHEDLNNDNDCNIRNDDDNDDNDNDDNDNDDDDDDDDNDSIKPRTTMKVTQLWKFDDTRKKMFGGKAKDGTNLNLLIHIEGCLNLQP